MKVTIPVIEVVYKSKDGNWRGFCYPYDVTCNADSKEKTLKKLEDLVETYEECIGQYNNPRNLVINELSDKEDTDVFKKIWPSVSKKIADEIRSSVNPDKYSDSLNGRISFNSGIISYSHKSLAVAVK